TAKPLYATLARGALLCLDSMAAPHPRPLGILCPELPRLRTARLPRCPLQAILRQVLRTRGQFGERPWWPRRVHRVRGALLSQIKRFSKLKRWEMDVAKRRGSRH